jgi:hypothetical protein
MSLSRLRPGVALDALRSAPGGVGLGVAVRCEEDMLSSWPNASFCPFISMLQTGYDTPHAKQLETPRLPVDSEEPETVPGRLKVCSHAPGTVQRCL